MGLLVSCPNMLMNSSLTPTSMEPEALEAWYWVSEFWEAEADFCGVAGIPTSIGSISPSVRFAQRRFFLVRGATSGKDCSS
jgi:hypothetical protein